ncbi:DUF4437 domain-containing protein [Hellea balneolensis]|uniref:DUF4437 domain-containing protein n=1 Tax=Hellea balneolensis TaxID=287478 RepID=UPI0004185D44|nr:DUF4437 domain-containing protein [Hellea balneolensis]
MPFSKTPFNAKYSISVIAASTLVLSAACQAQNEAETPLNSQNISETSVTITTPSELKFQPLNPARGDAAPQAGVLWGDIMKDVPSGVILRFADGFSSPPHIHNITYRAVVIEGHIHNDDPEAAKMWMGPGSYWTQPAGEPHITAAKPGNAGVAFLEIFSGPYLVQPSSEAFDDGELPINLVPSNMVWLSPEDTNWITAKQGTAAELTFLWGQPIAGEASGSLVKLGKGVDATLTTDGEHMDAVLIQGTLKYPSVKAAETRTLEAGSHIQSKGIVSHELSCEVAKCLIYIRGKGTYNLTASKS